MELVSPIDQILSVLAACDQLGGFHTENYPDSFDLEAGVDTEIELDLNSILLELDKDAPYVLKITLIGVGTGAAANLWIEVIP